MSDTGKGQRPRPEFELDLGRVGLLVIVPVGFWAYYTTFQGLKDITRQGTGDFAGVVGAIIGSAAILSLMALSSWKLGTDAAVALTGGRRARGTLGGLYVLIPVFLFFLSLSTFFSYTYYHSNFFGLSSRQMEGERQPRALATHIITLVDNSIGNAKAKLIKSTKDSSGAEEWKKGVDALIKAAGDGGNRFESIFKGKQQAAETAARQAAAEEQIRLKAIATAQAQIAKIQANIGEQQRVVDAANEVIRPQEATIAQLRLDQAKEIELAKAAAQGLDTSKVAKCGSICDGHNKNAEAKDKEATRIDQGLKGHRERRQTALKKIEELSLMLPDLERIAGSTPDRRVASQTVVAPDVKAALAALAAARENFDKDPTMMTIVGAERSCKTLLATAKEANSAGDAPPGFDCTIRAEDTKRLMEELQSFKRTEAEYRRGCLLTGQLGVRVDDITTRVRNATIPPPQGLVEARRDVQKCIATAGPIIGRDKVLESESEMDRFIREQSLDRNRFINATGALWRFDGDARMALSVALAQDLLILIYKFLADFYKYSSQPRRIGAVGPSADVSDNEADPADIRARTALLRLAIPARGETSRISDSDIRDEQLPEDVEANLRAMLNSFGRQDMAWRISNEVFGIENSVLRDIETQLQRNPARRTGMGRGFLASDAEGRLPAGPAADRQAGSDPVWTEQAAEAPAAMPETSSRRKRRSVRDLAADAAAASASSAAPRTETDFSRSSAAQREQRSSRDATHEKPSDVQDTRRYSFDELRKLNR